MDLDAEQHLAAAVQEFQPNATMSIKVLGGGHIVTHRDELQSGVVYSNVEIRDVKLNLPIWSARAKFDFSSGVDLGEWGWGQNFATSIVTQLRDHGLLQRCPTAAVGWPQITECSERRRRAFAERMRVGTQGGQTEVEPLPDCNR